MTELILAVIFFEWVKQDLINLHRILLWYAFLDELEKND